MKEDRIFTAAPNPEEDDIGELQVAEYLLMLLAFDTYAGFLEENGREFSTDTHGQKGLKILRVVDSRNSDTIEKFLDQAITREVSKKQLVRTFKVKVATPVHASRRALSLRTILNRGGPSTVKAIFQEARARKAAKAAIASHMLDDPSEALTKYSVISIQNVRIKSWVRACVTEVESVTPGESEIAQTTVAESAPIESAADVAASAAKELKSSQMAEDGASSAEEIQAAQEEQAEILTRVQQEATEAAQEALYASGDADDVPSKAEVVGIATAAAVAASAEVGDQDNIPEPSEGYQDATPLATKIGMMAKTKWSGNGVTPAQAMAQATTEAEMDAARWYEMYEGFKGSLGPDWAPKCDNRAEAKREWDRFNDRNRIRMVNGSKVRIRLGDFDDMISVFRDILKRRPDIREKVHKAFSHVLVDECQDLNGVQSEVLSLMTGHITDGSDGKSYWMVGDPDQSIYAFRGAKPEQFVALDGAEGWKTRLIRTNYRCPPEVVEMANRLIANNTDRMEKEANPAPGRGRGQASIMVETTPDEAAAAMGVVRQIKLGLENEETVVSDNAVLCRTNAELNSYETALLLKGVPYARKGSSSFLGSPETKSFLGYISLATSTDHKQMQDSLVDILNRPNRFFVGPDKVERAVDYALSNYARKNSQDKQAVHPRVALRDPSFQEDIVYMLKGVKSGFKAKKAFNQLDNLIEALGELDQIAADEESTTKDLFDAVLEMPGIKFDVDPYTGRIRGESPVTFRDELTASLKDYGVGDDGTVEEEGEGGLGLGNVSFLYELAKPDPEDAGDQELSPETPRGFWAKMERLQARVKDLRYDTTAWEDAQNDLPPEDRKPAPGVYLGTVHSTKGVEWENVFVQMPGGKFPMDPRSDDDRTEEVRAILDTRVWKGSDRFSGEYSELWTFERRGGSKYASDGDATAILVAEKAMLRDEDLVDY